jgi:hypothetical protein
MPSQPIVVKIISGSKFATIKYESKKKASENLGISIITINKYMKNGESYKKNNIMYNFNIDGNIVISKSIQNTGKKLLKSGYLRYCCGYEGCERSINNSYIYCAKHTPKLGNSCKEFPNYLVTRDGIVFHKDRRKPLKGTIHPTGRKIMSLVKNGKTVGISLHRLIGLVYWERPEDFGDGSKYQAAHLDEDLTNDHADNGEWQTSKQNGGDAARKAVRNGNNMGPSKKIKVKIIQQSKIQMTSYKNVAEASKYLGIKDFQIRKSVKNNKQIDIENKIYKFEWDVENILNEVWKQVPTKDGTFYPAEISNMGRIRSKLVLPTYGIQNGNYLVTGIGKGKLLSNYINILVCEAFNGGYKKGLHCCHLDGNSLNNKNTNLIFATPKVNNSHKTDNNKGFKPVKATSLHTGEVLTFKSVTLASKKLNLDKSLISSTSVKSRLTTGGWVIDNYNGKEFTNNEVSEEHKEMEKNDWIKATNLSTGNISYYQNIKSVSSILGIKYRNVVACLHNNTTTNHYMLERVHYKEVPENWNNDNQVIITNIGPSGMKVKAINGDKIEYFKTCIEASKKLGSSTTSINNILNGRAKKTNNGWRFEYINVIELSELGKKIKEDTKKKQSYSRYLYINESQINNFQKTGTTFLINFD